MSMKIIPYLFLSVIIHLLSLIDSLAVANFHFQL